MAAAYDLARAGHTGRRSSKPPTTPAGWLPGSKSRDWDWSVEKFYHHWFATDRHMLGLIDELGWSDQVLFPRPYTVMYYKGKFYPFDSILKWHPVPRAGLGDQQSPLRPGGAVPEADQQLAGAGKTHRRCLDAPVGGRPRLRADVGAADGRQVRRALCQAGQHGLDVGAAESPHHPPGHLQGRLPGFRRRICRPPGGDGGADPPVHAGGAHRARCPEGGLQPGYRPADAGASTSAW